MKRIPVKSSSVVLAIGYADASETLEVELVGGRVYRYFDVPWLEYQDFVNAESVGRYYNYGIKSRYDFEEVPPDPPGKPSRQPRPSCSRAASRSRRRRSRRH